MNLREEIYKLMTKARSWVEIEGHNSEYFTDEILKLFEKRIDSVVKEIESYIDSEDVEFGVDITIKKIKEMLQKE